VKRVAIFAAAFILVVLAILLHTEVKDWLWEHPWLHSFIVAIPTIALAVFAYLDLTHSEEANDLRRENLRLTEELDTERNKHLQQIADNTKRPMTDAERHAKLLSKHIRQSVSVSEGSGSNWSATPEIVEVKNGIVTLFTAKGFNSSSALATMVRCEDLEVIEMPYGSCSIRLRVLKRYGDDIKLGEITKWEDRNQPAAIVLPFQRSGTAAYYTTYVKGGSPETRGIFIYQAKDGSNMFELEAKPGGTFRGNNIDISKQFASLQIELEDAGFTRQGHGSPGGTYKLYLK
jgi:hypothetical protein